MITLVERTLVRLGFIRSCALFAVVGLVVVAARVVLVAVGDALVVMAICVVAAKVSVVVTMVVADVSVVMAICVVAADVTVVAMRRFPCIFHRLHILVF